MTAKYDAFIVELDALCKKYDVTVSSSYDRPTVWDGYDCDDIGSILDMTKKESKVGESLNQPSIEFKNVGNE